MPSKKVILFIVEGVTDEVSIGNIINKLNKDKKVYFQIVTKDITSDSRTTTANILEKVNEQLKECVLSQHFKKNDIIQIVHIVDIDGAFVKDEDIKYKDISGVEYSLECINTSNPEKIKERNARKSSVLNKLSSTDKVNRIPYSVYFFSSNLEHVLHNIQNAKDEEKMELAEKFEAKFYDNPEEFINFINDEEYALNDTYVNTWKFIKQGSNSLKRFTNFNLFFKIK